VAVRDEASTETPFELLASKLLVPRMRSSVVDRPALLERLCDVDGPPIVAVTAAAGYGKTTLLARWAEADERDFAWVSLDGSDNDPHVLLSYVATSLNRVEPIDPSVFDALASSGTSIAGVVVPRLGRALASMTRPIVLVLDDAHLLHDRECRSAIAVLAEHLPVHSRLAIAARSEPPLRVARLRAEGRVLELGPSDLSLDHAQAAVLLRDAGAEVSDPVVAELRQKTEGWPVGLYFAALSIRAGGSASKAVAAFDGGDPFVSEYLHFELLSRLPAKEGRFLRRSAVLNRMSGPLCDAVLEGSGSAETLAQMQRSNQLVVPLDRSGEWYRYHHLFRDMLLMELDRSEPDLAVTLRGRAARWHEEHGALEEAIGYAMLAGDEDTVARLVGEIAIPMHWAGRISTVMRWFRWIQDRGPIERYPLVAVQASWLFATTGYAGEAERWADAVEREDPDAARPEEPPLTGVLRLLLRAAMCRRGVEAMRVDAEEAVELFGGTLGTPYLVLGVALLMSGDTERADRAFRDAVEVSAAVNAAPDLTLSLAERSLLAIARGAWDEAEVFAEEARSIARSSRIEEYSTTALVYAAAARLALHDGEAQAAREHLLHAQRLRGQLTRAVPHIAVQARIELAHSYVGLGEIAGARTLLWEIDELLRERPDLGTLVGQAEQLRAQLALHQGSPTGGFQTLTAAELRLLPLLPTHLTFRELGEELYVSPNTVKSQAMSIYRKLNVSSRSDAVSTARQIGLLEG